MYGVLTCIWFIFMAHVTCKYTIHGCNGNVLYDWHRRSGIAQCVFNPTNDCNTKIMSPRKKKNMLPSTQIYLPYSLAKKSSKKKLFSLFVPYFHPTRKLQAALHDDSVCMGVPAGWLRTLRKRLSILLDKGLLHFQSATWIKKHHISRGLAGCLGMFATMIPKDVVKELR